MKANKKIFSGEKGFSFTFDALIASLVLLMVIVYTASSTANAFDFSSQKIVQKQVADDLLNTAGELGKITAMNSAELDYLIQSQIPPNYDYRLEIRKYIPNENFTVQDSLLSGNLTRDLNTTNYVESEKIAVSYYNNDVNALFGAKIRVWVK
jgi:hypothetical protein